MKKNIGEKNLFAIEIDIVKYEPWIWGRSCLWINNIQIGDYDDENILSPFIRSLMRIALKYQALWFDELNGLECKELFYLINPFYNNPDEFYNLTFEEQGNYIKYDIFNFQFGENFDQWILRPIVKNDICKFLWVQIPKGDNDTYETRNNIQCFDIPLKNVQKVYRDLCNLIPNQYWPSTLEKL